MVVEFPKLQGTMGKVYADKSGEPVPISMAIEEHYRPTHSGGPLPETVTGAILGIADKVDTLCGCFSIGLIPTGASDPYALRRQAIGIIQIMLNQNFGFSLTRMLETSLKFYNRFDPSHIVNTATAVQDFLQNRMSFILAEQGHAKDIIAAVLNASSDHIPHVWKRVLALEALKSDPDFELLTTAFKRIVNIIRKADIPAGNKSVISSLFQDPSESFLYMTCQQVKQQVIQHLDEGDFTQALRTIASLRDPIDTFFNSVLVMAPDGAVRNNRLTILAGIASLFDSIADFTKISS